MTGLSGSRGRICTGKFKKHSLKNAKMEPCRNLYYKAVVTPREKTNSHHPKRSYLNPPAHQRTSSAIKRLIRTRTVRQQIPMSRISVASKIVVVKKTAGVAEAAVITALHHHLRIAKIFSYPFWRLGKQWLKCPGWPLTAASTDASTGHIVKVMTWLPRFRTLRNESSFRWRSGHLTERMQFL